MFRQLAYQLPTPPGPAGVFEYHPLDIADYLENVWAERSDRAALSSLQRPEALAANSPLIPPPDTVWHNLIYALAIESTRIFEIFDRVAYECLHGERLGVLSGESHMWLRNTEDLLYKPPPDFSIYGVKSQLRPDYRAVRRNAYYRLFGKELPNFNEEGIAFVRPEASNVAFEDIFEEFLRQVWVGIQNVSNISGPNQSDDQAIANLARRLQVMLTDRRLYGNLSREEFFAIAAASWFHLTVEGNHPIIRDLRADGSNEEQRLRKVGEKVNLPPHMHADSYFQMAVPLSDLLVVIESGALNDPANVPVLYVPGSAMRADAETIITHWSITSGRNLKAVPVSVT